MALAEVTGNEELELEAQRQAEKDAVDAFVTLAEAIEQKFAERKGKRSVKEGQWLLCESLYLGSVANDGISHATSDHPFQATRHRNRRAPKHNIVGRKVDAVVSILWAKQFAGGDKNWDVLPDKNPTDGKGNPIDPMEAARKADLMEDTVETQLRDARYGWHCREAMIDRVRLGTGITKGPINLGRMDKKYAVQQTSEGMDVRVPQIVTEACPHVARVDPWLFYPDDTAVSPDKIEDTIELHPMSRSELRRLALNPSFLADQVHEVLKEEPAAMASNTTSSGPATLNDNTEVHKNKYQVLEYYGPVTRTDLMELDLEPNYDSPDDVYYAEVWVVNTKIIRLDLHPIEGSFSPPYAVCPYIRDPGSVFGIGLPLLLADQQQVVDSIWKMVLDNSSISSGPQTIINKSTVKPADGTWKLNPDKVWYNTEYAMGANAANAINFFTPPNVTQELMGVLNLAKSFGDEESGIPLLAAGLQSPESQMTATGTVALMEASTTPIDYLNEMWDDLVTDKIITGFIDWNMQYNPDENIKGDFELDVKSSSDIRSRAMYVGDLEKLSVEASQNPAMGMLINQDELTRARLSVMRIPHKLIVKSPEEVAQAQQEAANTPSPEEIKAQQEQVKLEIEQIKLQTAQIQAQADMQRMQLELQKLQAETSQAMQLAQWKHEEVMGANAARQAESQAQVLTAATQERIEYLKLAQKDGMDKAKVMVEMNKIQVADDRERFFKGIDTAMEANEQNLFQQELELARTSPDNDGI